MAAPHPDIGALYLRHRDSMYGVAASVLRGTPQHSYVEDVVMETIASIIQRPPAGPVENWEAFLVRARWANPPRDPDLVDRLLESVEPLVKAKDPESAADVLGGWLRQAGIGSPNATTFSRITQPSAALQPVIDEALRRCGRAHTLIQRRLVGQDGLALDQRGWGPDDVPQLVWPCALPEGLRHSTRPDQRILRAVVSMILVRMCTEAQDWVEVGAALGFPPEKSRNWTRYAFAARWNLKNELLATAEALADRMTMQGNELPFARRGKVRGYGVHALREAQSPPCDRGRNAAWCPCSVIGTAFEPDQALFDGQAGEASDGPTRLPDGVTLRG